MRNVIAFGRCCGRIVSRPNWCGLAMELDVCASILALHTFGARIASIARQAALNALITRLLAGCCSRKRCCALSSSVRSTRQRLFARMALVYMSREQIASGKLITTVLAFVRSVTSVRTHMPRHMLRPSKCCLADRALVVSSHYFLQSSSSWIRMSCMSCKIALEFVVVVVVERGKSA